MSKKSVKMNYIYNMMYQLLIIILPIITTPYLSRVLGAQSIGIYSYTISITTYFILIGSLGISMYGQREISYSLDNIEKRTFNFCEITVLRFITLITSMIIFYFVFARTGEYAVYYRILCLEIIANCFEISWFFQGLEDFKKMVVRNTIVKIISIICIFLFIKGPQDIDKYLIIYVLSTIFGNVSLWFYLPKYLKKIDFKKINILKHLKPTIALFLPQIAVQIYTVLDKTMIGTIISDKVEVGYYEEAQKVIKMLLIFITSVGTVMVPRMASIYAKGRFEELKVYMKKTINFVFFLSIPMIFGIICISKYFVPIFFGDGFEKVIVLMNIICPIFLIIGMSTIVGTQYFIPTKKQKEFTISVTIGALINILLNFILIPKYASIGASIATVIAELTVTVIMLFLARKDFNILKIIKLSYNYLFAGIIMFLINYILAITLLNNFSNITNILVQIIVGGFIYIFILYLLNDDFLKYIFSLIKQKFIKK